MYVSESWFLRTCIVGGFMTTKMPALINSSSLLMVKRVQSSWGRGVAFQRATASVLQHQSSMVSTLHQSSLTTTLQAPIQNYTLVPRHRLWQTVLHLQLTVQAPNHLPMLNQFKICFSVTHLFNAFQLQNKRNNNSKASV